MNIEERPFIKIRHSCDDTELESLLRVPVKLERFAARITDIGN